jgi:hypothetical protein
MRYCSNSVSSERSNPFYAIVTFPSNNAIGQYIISETLNKIHNATIFHRLDIFSMLHLQNCGGSYPKNVSMSSFT